MNSLEKEKPNQSTLGQMAKERAKKQAKAYAKKKIIPILIKLSPALAFIGLIFLLTYALGLGGAALFAVTPEKCASGTTANCGPPDPCSGGCKEGYLLDRDDYYATDAYAIAPTSYRPGYHNGVDIGCAFGENMLSPIEGTVLASVKGGLTTTKNADGEVVITYSPTGTGMGYVTIEDAIGLRWRYVHGFETYVKVGDKVQAGQRIAECASTGLSTGSHIHFDVAINHRNTKLDTQTGLPEATDRANTNWHLFINWWDKAKNPKSTYKSAVHLDPVVTMAAVWKVDVCPAYTDIYKNRAEMEGVNITSILRCFKP